MKGLRAHRADIHVAPPLNVPIAVRRPQSTLPAGRRFEVSTPTTARHGNEAALRILVRVAAEHLREPDCCVAAPRVT